MPPKPTRNHKKKSTFWCIKPTAFTPIVRHKHKVPI
uniref:Uncharacterized protein n=1 Tax=Arundo donax TaxID=35708 RepID=A0A0A8YDI4_ARUDO